MINYYSILEIHENATSAEIKGAFKRLAVKYHPDKNPDKPEMEERFKEVNEAYQTLSNPYEKARYDIRLKYGFYTPPEPPVYEYTQEIHQSQTYQRRRAYSEPQINWRENWIATAYAFGFTFIVGCIVLTGIFIKNQIDKRNFEEMLAERRATFEEAQRQFALGEVENALQKLNGLGGFVHEREADMETYKVALFESFIFNGETGFYEKDYSKAIYYYSLIERYSPFKPIMLKEHLAKAYQNSKQPHQAIKIMKELLILGQSSLDLYLQMARIYRDDLKDPYEALRYFKLADETAINQYKSYYGEAYVLIINASALSKIHYDIYTELAGIYLEVDSAAKAVKVTDWNIKLWPDSVANYVIAGTGSLKIGQQSKACSYFRKATRLGYKHAPELCQR